MPSLSEADAVTKVALLTRIVLPAAGDVMLTEGALVPSSVTLIGAELLTFPVLSVARATSV